MKHNDYFEANRLLWSTDVFLRDKKPTTVASKDETEYEAIAMEIAELVAKKNKAYGNSVEVTKHLMAKLYPNGVSVSQYDDALLVVRVLDKLMRIATDKDAFGESPWKDIMGYALSAIKNKPCK